MKQGELDCTPLLLYSMQPYEKCYLKIHMYIYIYYLLYLGEENLK